MVRATRATQLALEYPSVPVETNLSPTTSSLATKKPANRKRKRTSTDEDLGLDASLPDKELNGADVREGSEDDEKEGDKHEVKKTSKQATTKRQKTKPSKYEEPMVMDISESLEPKHQDAGDVFLSEADAKNILIVLESLDGASLLDRQFDLPEGQLSSTSKDAEVSTSLRAMLSRRTAYPLRVLANALRTLSPKTPLNRSTTSQALLQEQGFLTIAVGLLDEVAAQHAGAIDLTRTNLDPDVDLGAKALAEDTHPTKKYALYQHLPNGDFFTSVTSMTPQEASAIPKGQASLVFIQPTVVIDPSFLPKLGSYSRPLKPSVVPPNRLPISRKMASGSFLDYGPYASFAPTFDSDAGEMGDQDLADYLWAKRQRKQKRPAFRPISGQQEAMQLEDGDEDMTMDSSQGVTSTASASAGSSTAVASTSSGAMIDPALEMEDELRAAMVQVQMESGIDDLLGKNAWALQRLAQLQNERYRVGAKAPEVVGGEEWNLAQSILKSLTALASLRPRTAGSSSGALVPPPSILRALHRTLPQDPIPGWKGTMTRERGDMAYRDNSTITPGATPYVNPTPTPVAPPPAQPKPQTYHPQSTPAPAQYSYSQQQYQQRPGMAATPGGSYYAGHPYYAQYATNAQMAAGGGARTPMPQNQYYYNPYPQYAGYYGQTAGAGVYGGAAHHQQQAQVGTPSRAIPNMAKPGSYMPPAAATGWGTPVAGGARTPTTPGMMAYGGSPVYPPTPGYAAAPGGYAAAAWPPQKA